MKFTCKNRCKQFKGYQQGYFHFHIEGKRYCNNCNYKIVTNNRTCSCCNGFYRSKPVYGKIRQDEIIERRMQRRREKILTIK